MYASSSALVGTGREVGGSTGVALLGAVVSTAAAGYITGAVRTWCSNAVADEHRWLRDGPVGRDGRYVVEHLHGAVQKQFPPYAVLSGTGAMPEDSNYKRNPDPVELVPMPRT